MMSTTALSCTVGRGSSAQLLSDEGFGYNYGRLKSSASRASRENTWLRRGAYTVVTRGGGHVLSEKSQRIQNGTMFVDLD